MEENTWSPCKKTGAWLRTLWLSYVTELQDRIFMSWKRILKFLGISLIPIIYGVVCMVAFWNPIANLGRAPVAIFNEDHNIILVKQFAWDENKFAPKQEANESKALYKVGALVNPDKITNPDNPDVPGWKDSDATFFTKKNTKTELEKYIQEEMKIGQTYTLNNGQTFVYSQNTFVTVTSLWEIMKGMMLPKTNDQADENYIFKTAEIAEGMAFTNIHYISNVEIIDHEWTNARYYIQARITPNYTANFFGWWGDVLAHKLNLNPGNDQDPSAWKELIKPLDIWTTFERNFIFGYYMQTFTNFASGLIYQTLPNLFAKILTGNIMDEITIEGAVLDQLNQPTPNPSMLGKNQQIKMAENYVVLRTGKFGDFADVPWLENQKRVNPISLFGNLKVNGDYEKGQVGGKFLQFLEDVRLFKKSGALEIVKKALPGVNASVIEMMVNLVTELIEIANDEESLNATIYQIITGQWNYQPSKTMNGKDLNQEIWNFLGDLGFDINNPDHLKKQVTIFPLENDANEIIFADALLTDTLFSQQIDNFMANNPNTFHGKIGGLGQWPAVIAAKMVSKLLGGMEVGDFVTLELQGAKNGFYGIGLGQFFLVIGLWVGVLMQTFVFDRAKRVTKAGPSQWYLSKTMLMGTVVLLQATLEIWVAYACGFHQIGLQATALLWLWFMAAGLLFVIIIQALWFSFKDETIGKFLAVIVMVFSLAAGGGTFPAFAQFKFFEVISYVVPFTYVLRGTGAIIYGISINGSSIATTNVILSNWWPFFIYIFLFLSLGLGIGAPRRYREMNWGSANGRKVSAALIALGRNPDEMHFRSLALKTVNGHQFYHYHWNVLEPRLDLPLYLKCREMFPFEGQFKWWQKKAHDPVQRPNYSDEDIMTRNE